jgi:Fic family protein
MRQQQDFYEYAMPDETPSLMEKWLNDLNRRIDAQLRRQEAIGAYTELHISFGNIHPFFDGNGRVARLISNLPVLKSGYPPILIPLEKRREYLNELVEHQLDAVPPSVEKELVKHGPSLEAFKSFCLENWRASLSIVDKAHERQKARR